MLQKIRDNSQGLAAKIFVWFVIVIFGAWGASTIVSSVISDTPALSVNGVDISEQEIERNTQLRIQDRIQQMGDNADTSSIDEEAMREAAVNELIERQLLLQHAAKTGMVVSGRSLDRRIAQTPDFQVDGAFNAERAQLLLQSMGYTPNSYRAALASEGLINQTTFTYGLSSFVTKPEMQHLASLLNQTRDLRYILINLEDQLSEMEVTDEEVETYYSNHESEFLLPEQVSLQYLELDKDDIFDEVTVTEEAVRRRYDEEVAEFQAQIERRASHILLEATSDEEYDNAMAQARELKDRIDNGESFEDLAKEYSDDLGSAEEGGDVGYTNGDNFVQEFEQALGSLDVGEVSDPVRTDFGVHLIKLTEQSESEMPSFEESRDRIERDLKTTEVDRLFTERSEELGNLAFESFDLSDPADIMGLEIQTTDLFDRNGGVGIASNRDVVNTAFGTDVLIDGLNSNLISISPSRSVVIRVLEHNQPKVQPLEAVRGEIQVQLQQDKVSAKAAEMGRTLTQNLQKGLNVNAMLELQDLSWNDIKGLERNEPALPPELVDDIFNMDPPAGEAPTIDGFQLSGGEFVVVELQQVHAGSLEDMEEDELASMKNFLAQQNANTNFAALITGLKERADITR